MPTIKADIWDSKDLQAKLLEIPERTRRPIKDTLTAGAMVIRADAATLVQRGPASGTIYEKYKPRRTHQASAAGEPPMSDTGRLASAIHWNVASDGLSSRVQVMSDQADYGWFLEHGTSKMEPRPFMQPAYEGRKDWFISKMIKALRSVLRKTARKKGK